jgi:oxygen-independent coproporphyrinogen III oxidase
MKPLGLYIHIPFCRRKCYYCDFVSFPNREDAIDAYIGAVIAEARLYGDLFSDHAADTVFVGGGTPSMLNAAQMERLLCGLKEACNVDAAEFTVEANPETLSEEKLACYKRCGVNRLSLGLQTHDDAILAAIGRRHTFKTFTSALEITRKHFNNISADTIFALPGQTVQSYEETIKRLIELHLPHISCYALKLEEGTKLAAEFSGADEDTDRGMYHAAVRILTEAGYRHYETSNFALPGFECKHNQKYWTGGEYLGLGIAAHSYLSGKQKTRSANTESLEDYLSLTAKGFKPAPHTEVLTEADELTEYLMLRLRLASGIDAEDYKQRFGNDFFTQFKQPVINTQHAGLITINDAGIRPTLKGFDLQNALIGEFIKKI